MTCKECGHYLVCGYVEHQDIECTHFVPKFALEKQIPQKVTDIHVDEYYCPSCGAENNKDDNCNYGDDYCPCCGQALDWGDGE